MKHFGLLLVVYICKHCDVVLIDTVKQLWYKLYCEKH